MLAADFSPSIFSPDEKTTSKLPLVKDSNFLSSSNFPLFPDLHSPPPAQCVPRIEEVSVKIELENMEIPDGLSRLAVRKNPKKGSVMSKMLNHVKIDNSLLSGCKSTPQNVLDLETDGFCSSSQETFKKEKVGGAAVKQITMKSKKLNRNLVVTPESTLIPPMLSPDQDSSRKLSMETPAIGSDVSVNHDSDSGSTVVLSSSRKSGKLAPTSSAGNGGSISGKTTCNCKKSKCLKLYCDCFAVLNYCDPSSCNCSQCHNVVEHEDTRTEAIRITKERNSLAFKTKISQQEQHHLTGCHCKNSHCLKKYCECFNGGALCGGNCKCQSCQNYSGSIELAKTRENSPKLDGSHSKKRKESPNSVSWLNCSPEISTGNLSSTSVTAAIIKEEKKSHYSLRGSNKVLEVGVIEEKKESIKIQSKKRKVTFAEPALTYPFFGPDLPEAPKRVALLVLDCLSGKDIYSMSQVNGIWCDAARDDALWE